MNTRLTENCDEAIVEPLDLSIRNTALKKGISTFDKDNADREHTAGLRSTFVNPWSEGLCIWNARKYAPADYHGVKKSVDSISEECIQPGDNGRVNQHNIETTRPHFHSAVSMDEKQMIFNKERTESKSTVTWEVKTATDGKRSLPIRDKNIHRPNTLWSHATREIHSFCCEDNFILWKRLAGSANTLDVTKTRKQKAKTWQVPVGHETPITATLFPPDPPKVQQNDVSLNLCEEVRRNPDNFLFGGNNTQYRRQPKHVTDGETEGINSTASPMLHATSEGDQRQTSAGTTLKRNRIGKESDPLRSLIADYSTHRDICHNDTNHRIACHMQNNRAHESGRALCKFDTGQRQHNNHSGALLRMCEGNGAILPRHNDSSREHGVMIAPVEPMNSKHLRLAPTPQPRASYQTTSLSPEDVIGFEDSLTVEKVTHAPLYLTEKKENTSSLILRNESDVGNDLYADPTTRAPSKKTHRGTENTSVVERCGDPSAIVPVKQSGHTSSIQAAVRSTIASEICRYARDETRAVNVCQASHTPGIMAVFNGGTQLSTLVHPPQTQEKVFSQSFPVFNEKDKVFDGFSRYEDCMHHHVTGKSNIFSSTGNESGVRGRQDLHKLKQKHRQHELSTPGLLDQNVPYCSQENMLKYKELQCAFRDSDITRNILEQLNNLSASKLLEIQRNWIAKPDSDGAKKQGTRQAEHYTHTDKGLNNQPTNIVSAQGSRQHSTRPSPLKQFLGNMQDQLFLLQSDRVSRSHSVNSESRSPKVLSEGATVDRDKTSVISSVQTVSCDQTPHIYNNETPVQHTDTGGGTNTVSKLNPALRDALDARLSSVISANDSLLQAHEVPRKRPWSKKDWEKGEEVPCKYYGLSRTCTITQEQLPTPVFQHREDNLTDVFKLKNLTGKVSDDTCSTRVHVALNGNSTSVDCKLSQTTSDKESSVDDKIKNSNFYTQKQSVLSETQDSYLTRVHPPKKKRHWRQYPYNAGTMSVEPGEGKESVTADSKTEQLYTPIPQKSKTMPQSANFSDSKTFSTWLKEQLLSENISRQKSDSTLSQIQQNKQYNENFEISKTFEKNAEKISDILPENDNNMAGMIHTMIEVIMEAQT